MKDKNRLGTTAHRYFLAGAIMMLVFVASIQAQTTAFTYQGKLADSGNPANGNYDLQFKLFDMQAVGTGTQFGTTVTLSSVAVTSGSFSVQLDFGACASCFNGAARFLEIAVKPTSGATFTVLGPRQPLTSAPYAIKSQSAATADGLSVACSNCITSSQIQSVNGSAVSGTIPIASVPAGSASYIQNGTAQQAGTSFNIGGNGTVGGTLTGSIVNAVNQVNINGLRAFTVNGVYNGFFGTFTAANTFTGDGAGVNTTPSGTLSDQSGKLNAFYGAGAGQANTTGNLNTFYGVAAGKVNTTGCCNSFFGNLVGINNTTGQSNAFFGGSTGDSNTTGDYNAFFGDSADFNSTNTTGSYNTLLGSYSRVTANLTNATAIGARASVTQSNSLVLGSINGVNQATADTKVGIGTTAPTARLTVVGGGFPNNVLVSDSNTTATTIDLANTSTGGRTWRLQSLGNADSSRTGNFELWAVNGLNVLAIQPGGNVGIGTTAPDQKLSVNGNASKVGGGSWATFSDERLKNIRGNYTAGLSAILQLQPIRYEYKPENVLGLVSSGEHIGFSAQAVAKVIPEAVQRNAQGFLLINNDPIIWAALNAIKEQQAEIKSLRQELREAKQEQAQLAAQQRQFNEQQREMAAIRQLLCQSNPQADLCKVKPEK